MVPFVDIALAVGVLGVMGTLLAQTMTRVSRLEGEIKIANSQINRLWLYCRGLIDLYYRYRRDGSPEPPPMNDIWEVEE